MESKLGTETAYITMFTNHIKSAQVQINYLANGNLRTNPYELGTT